MEVLIKSSTLAGYAIAAFTAFLLPVTAWFVWRKKTAAKYVPLIAGVLAYVVISLARGILRFVMINDAVKQNPLSAYALMALISGVCEEVGRYLVFRFVISGYDLPESAVSYGIGHGGLEIIAVSGFGGASAGNFFLGTVYKLWGLKPFIDANCDTEETLEIMRRISEQSFFSSIPEIYGNLSALVFHTAMSLLVFMAVNYASDKKLLFAAVGIHTLTDIIQAVPFMTDITVHEKNVINLLVTAAACFFVYKVYAYYKEPNKIQ